MSKDKKPIPKLTPAMRSALILRILRRLDKDPNYQATLKYIDNIDK